MSVDYRRSTPRQQPVPELAPADANRLLAAGEALLLDVRETDEYRTAHVDGAQFIPLGQLATGLTDLPRTDTIVVICRSGRRSAEAIRFMRQAGFERLLNLTGGVLAWRAAGLPVIERGA
jgi:rhodanese-related sulfurtransferase